MSRTPGPCPNPVSPPARSPTFLTPSLRRCRTRASSQTSTTSSGPRSTSSTAQSTASNVTSTPTSRRKSAGRRNRTARKSAPSNSSGSPAKGKARSSAATRWSSFATRPPSTTNATPFPLATANGIQGQPPRADLGDDRQPRLSLRQAPGRERSDAAPWSPDRPDRRFRLQRPRADLGQARQAPRPTSRHGAPARRDFDRRRTHRRPLGRRQKGPADRVQAGLEATRQGGALQAQRRHARDAPDRGLDISRLRDSGQPRRQGPDPRDSRLEAREKPPLMGAVFAKIRPAELGPDEHPRDRQMPRDQERVRMCH